MGNQVHSLIFLITVVMFIKNEYNVFVDIY